MEPRTLCALSTRSTTELRLRPVLPVRGPRETLQQLLLLRSYEKSLRFKFLLIYIFMKTHPGCGHFEHIKFLMI